jgi:hypothetical protein
MNMMKKLLMIATLTWIGAAYSAPEIAKETIEDAASYKIDKPTPEQKASRSFAGSKAKKEAVELKEDEIPSESDSELRYWKYQESSQDD